MDQIFQSGVVKPQRLAEFVTFGVASDSGVPLYGLGGTLTSVITGVNFNSANSDNPIAIDLPVGFEYYRIHDIIISGASGNCSAATCGVFTKAGGAGLAIVASGTAVTVTSGSNDAANNMQSLPITNQNITALIDTTIFFRVLNSQGSTATANVTVNYEPLPL